MDGLTIFICMELVGWHGAGWRGAGWCGVADKPSLQQSMRCVYQKNAWSWAGHCWFENCKCTTLLKGRIEVARYCICLNSLITQLQQHKSGTYNWMVPEFQYSDHNQRLINTVTCSLMLWSCKVCERHTTCWVLHTTACGACTTLCVPHTHYMLWSILLWYSNYILIAYLWFQQSVKWTHI